MEQVDASASKEVNQGATSRMVSPLTGLPSELQMEIFGDFRDLDQAACLSMTCKYFHGFYEEHKDKIQGTIILHSSVYQFDLILVKYNELRFQLAGSYAVIGRFLPDEMMLHETAGERCHDTTWAEERLAPEVIERVAESWSQSKYLQRLYRDETIGEEYEMFRREYWEKSRHPYQSVKVQETWMRPEDILGRIGHLLQPGISSRCFRLSESLEVCPDFKERFHQAICLHSIAVASRAVALASKVEGHPHPDDDSKRSSFSKSVKRIAPLWSKSEIAINGHCTTLAWGTKLDCLEVWDFIYLFLLRKVIPIESLHSWVESNPPIAPLDTWTWTTGYPGEEISGWYTLLNAAIWFFQPHDIFDLLKHAKKYDYPPDKNMYLKTHGIEQKYGLHATELWYAKFKRPAMIRSFEPKWCPEYRIQDSCAYDYYRTLSRSPFDVDYDKEILGAVPIDHDRCEIYQVEHDNFDDNE